MYIRGDYYLICDRCGGQFRRSRMKQEWTGSWVCDRDWERRQPQDFVTSSEDIQTVPVSRPDVPQTMGETTLAVSATQWATDLELTSGDNLAKDDPIGITLDNGLIHWSFLTGDPAGAKIVIHEGIFSAATAGNKVYLPSINSENWA